MPYFPLRNIHSYAIVKRVAALISEEAAASRVIENVTWSQGPYVPLALSETKDLRNSMGVHDRTNVSVQNGKDGQEIDQGLELR